MTNKKDQIVNNKYNFTLLFDVMNGNPNGDPDAGNMPRIDPETGYGLVTDVCLKSKIRRYVDLLKNDEEGYRLYIKNDASLNAKDEEALKFLSCGDENALKKMKKDKLSREQYVQARNFMCANFWDIRTFGAVITTFSGSPAGQVLGPVQLEFSHSIDPIVPQCISITRHALTKEDDMKNKENTMGNKYIVPYGLYRVDGYISPAKSVTKFSEADLELFWDALIHMFEEDHSAVRGKMTVRDLIVFRHDSPLGLCPAHQLFDRIEVERSPSVEVARAYTDYTVSVADDDLPNGVSLIPMVRGGQIL